MIIAGKVPQIFKIKMTGMTIDYNDHKVEFDEDEQVGGRIHIQCPKLGTRR